jgi:histidinol-phosphate phosphatase family protein
MVPVCGTPLVEHQLDLCRRSGFSSVLLLGSREPTAVAAQFGDGSRLGLTIGYQVEPDDRGSAGAIRDACSRLADVFLVLDADRYADVDLRRLWRAHAMSRADATLTVHPSERADDCDLVTVDSEGGITGFLHAGGPDRDRYRNLASQALYVLTRAVVEEHVPIRGRVDLARDTLPLLLAGGARLRAYRSPEYVRDVGTPARLERVERDLERGVAERLSGRQGRAAVFLDRDGTINREAPPLTSPDQLELIPGAAGAIRRLNESGRLALVITNQAVVARGQVTLEGLERIHARLDHLLGQQGAYLDRLYACPHHPDRGMTGEAAALKITCRCRKPATGSIDAACRDFGVDLGDSWFVGDATLDIETGRRAGLKTVLLRTGHAGQDGRFPFDPDYVVADLDAAVTWILDAHPVVARRILPVADAAFRARLVVVGGLPQAGKSSAAQALRETMAALGRTAHVLAIDSWRVPARGGAGDVPPTACYDVPALTATIAALADARQHQTIELPVYDRAHRSMYERPRRLDIRPTDLLIVEGVPALLLDDLCRLAQVRVHLEVPEAERRARLRADYEWRGLGAAEVEAALAAGDRDDTGPVRDARARADLVITSSSSSSSSR